MIVVLEPGGSTALRRDSSASVVLTHPAQGMLFIELEKNNRNTLFTEAAPWQTRTTRYHAPPFRS